MDLLVLGQVVVADEGFPALVALVALVVVVDPEVESVGAAVPEALATDAAQVRLLAAVDPQVLLQRRPVGGSSCGSVRLHAEKLQGRATLTSPSLISHRRSRSTSSCLRACTRCASFCCPCR